MLAGLLSGLFVTNLASLFLGRSLLVCPLPEVDFSLHWLLACIGVRVLCTVALSVQDLKNLQSAKVRCDVIHSVSEEEMKLKVSLKQRFET